ncbi:MAG: twin-arginine translocase subunit TatC [Deltaproteobacteria bacterium]|nr:MAG: twin-arginine translocase subunit TatC [Deltaproteobacteria bacterium]
MSTSEGNGQSSDVQMPFTSHLAELRSRLIKSTLAIAVGFSACYAIVDDLFAILAAPVRRLQIRGLALIGTTVTEAFFTKMKVSFIAAIIIASPIWLWQAWQFVAPGLYEHEKRYTRSFVFFGSLFFIGGAVFCYEIVIQQGLSFLLHRYEVIDVRPLLQIGDYLSLVSRLVLVDHRFLIRHSRYAVIALALLAAVLTPPDLISQVLLMAPLILLYGISIAAAYIARWRMNRLERGAE